MDVIVDGERNFRLEGSPADVLSAVVAITTYLRDRRRGVLSVKLDGTPVSSDAIILDLSNKPLSDVHTIEVISENIHKLVSTCLEELEAALPDLPGACHSLAEVFQGEAPEDGYDPFRQLAEIWSNIKSREFLVAGALGAALEDLEIEGLSIVHHHQQLNDLLREAAEALEVGDRVVLGDLLEYELAPRAETEAKIVTLLRARAGQWTG